MIDDINQFFRPKVYGLFANFPRPYFEISRTFLNMNLPTVQPKNNARTRSGSRSSCTAEHASGEKKLNCASSARSSKTKKFKILSARSRKKLQEATSPTKPQYLQEVYSSWLNQQYRFRAMLMAHTNGKM